MRRKLLLIAVGVLAVAYLVWNSQSGGAETTNSYTVPTTTTAGNVAVSGSARPSPSPVTTPTPAGPTALLLNSARAMRGATVNASGFGFQPFEQLRLERENPGAKPTTLTVGKADKDGNFSLSFKVEDAWPDNARVIQVVGVKSGRQASANIEVDSGNPGALPSTYFGKPLTPVDFSGGGFRPGETVSVYFDSLATSRLGTYTADQYGTVHVKGIQVPLSTAGQHAFLLVGQNSAAPVRIPFSVLDFSPWLSLSSYTPQPEQSVTVTGHDFAPGERVALFLNQPTGQPVVQGAADKKGNATLPSFAVPWNIRGPLIVVVVGSETQKPVQTTLKVRPYTPTFEISSYAGPPGSTISAKGQGFAKNETLTLTLGEGAGAPTITAHTDAKGNLVGAPIHIPTSAQAGKLTVQAVGDHSQQPAQVTYAVLPLPAWISPVPAAGPSGTKVTFEGGSFEPGEPVKIEVAGNPPGPSVVVTADQKGNLHHAGALKISGTGGDKVTLQATGQTSGVKVTATFTVTGGPE